MGELHRLWQVGLRGLHKRFATIVNLTHAFEIANTLFGIWQNKMFDFNLHQWCVNLPRGAPHMGQVDKGGMVSHNI